MFEIQNGLCAICNQPETQKFNNIVKRLAVDHNHSTGKLRKLLCYKCNTGIGQFNDDINLLAKAIQYLEENK